MIHKQILAMFFQIPVKQQPAYSEFLYQGVLNIVERHSDNARCRVFALEVGRLHYGLHRGLGNVTIYDEQAMQNGIFARSTAQKIDNSSNSAIPHSSSEHKTSNEMLKAAGNERDGTRIMEHEIEGPADDKSNNIPVIAALVLLAIVVYLGAKALIEGRGSDSGLSKSASQPIRDSNTSSSRVGSSGQGTNSTNDNYPLKDFIQRAAKDYGIPEEQARQSFRKGAALGYPDKKEEIDRLLGPEK